jgi:hypothetical protein
MYFLDRHLVVQDCNDDLASLIGCRPGEILGKHVRFLIERFAQRVPKSRRSKFLKDQLEMVDDQPDTVAPNLGGHRDAEEYIDNRKFSGDRYPHLYHVWIHSDKIYTETYGEVVGIFVVFRLEKLPEDARI